MWDISKSLLVGVVHNKVPKGLKPFIDVLGKASENYLELVRRVRKIEEIPLFSKEMCNA